MVIPWLLVRHSIPKRLHYDQKLKFPGGEADATQLLESTSGCRMIEFCTYPMGNEPAKSNKNLRETVQEDDEVRDGEGSLGGETMQLEDEEQALMEWVRIDLAGENQGETLNTRTGAKPKRLPDTYNSGQHLVRTSHPIGNLLNGERCWLLLLFTD